MTNPNQVREVLAEYEAQPELLRQLDAFLHATDAPPAGISGKIAIGVRGAAGTKWWMAELGRYVRTSFPGEPDRDVDAALLFEAGEADSIARGKKVERFSTHVFGDRALLQSVFDRYFKHTSSIGLRSS